MIEFVVLGNWERVTRAIEDLPKSIRVASVRGQKKAAEKLIKIVKGHINNQDLGWFQRSDSTHSGDSRILVDTEAYLNAIKFWRVGELYYAGVKRTAFNSKGERISDYALINEFGSARIPARPLWGPSFEEMGGEKGIKRIVSREIHNQARKLRQYGFEISFRL
jgi:hypothetical protein